MALKLLTLDLYIELLRDRGKPFGWRGKEAVGANK